MIHEAPSNNYNMPHTNTLIIGASFSGLALAACLQKHRIDYVLIEKHHHVASSWRAHYDRLHLHTNKRVSNLPYKKFGKEVPLYPTRLQVIEYLEDYQKTFNINPIFNTEALSIRKEGDHWVVETNNGTYTSRYLIMATGVLNKPKPVNFKGMDTFPGKLIHSADYKTGKDFKGKKVLVVGFGNSACEIAIDLYEQGARPSMSVRSPVNVIPRDIMGIPILELSQFMSKLPPRLADKMNAPLMRLLIGDLTKFGLKKMPYGPFEEIYRDRNIPVMDVGTIKLIKKGAIKVHGEIDYINGHSVHFSDGTHEAFDNIVACIGFDHGSTSIAGIHQARFEDLKHTTRQKIK